MLNWFLIRQNLKWSKEYGVGSDDNVGSISIAYLYKGIILSGIILSGIT